MSRTENSVRNLKYGVAYLLVDVALKFVMRTALVYSLGDAVVGLNGLFTEVLSMLSLAEMGVGTAILYSLYQPLAERDIPKIAQLMALFRRAYRVIALVILAIGLALLPFVHLLVRKVEFDLSYIRVVYLLYLLATASSYLLSYKAVLLTADQRAYNVTRVKMVMDVVVTLFKTAALLIFRNFLLFLVINAAGQIARNFFISRAANRVYPFLRDKAELPSRDERKQVMRNVRNLFIGKLSGTLTSSTDNTLISVMDSTLSVGFYSNYAMIINNARTFLLQIVAASAGSIGNQMTQDAQGCYRTLKRLTMLMFIAGSVVCSCFYSQLSPLITVWLGESRVLSRTVVDVLLLNLFIYAIREPLWQFLTVSGLFGKDKNISIIGSVVNLIISVALGIPLGMLGIFIGTTATLVIQFALKARLLCREKFGFSPKRYYGMALSCLASALASAAISGALCGLLFQTVSLLSVALGVLISAAVTLLIGYLCFSGTDEYRYCAALAKRYAMRLIGKIRRG